MEIVDDSRKWWKVKNYQDRVGYLPGNLLEVILPKKKSGCECYSISVPLPQLNKTNKQLAVECVL